MIYPFFITPVFRLMKFPAHEASSDDKGLEGSRLPPRLPSARSSWKRSQLRFLGPLVGEPGRSASFLILSGCLETSLPAGSKIAIAKVLLRRSRKTQPRPSCSTYQKPGAVGKPVFLARSPVCPPSSSISLRYIKSKADWWVWRIWRCAAVDKATSEPKLPRSRMVSLPRATAKLRRSRLLHGSDSAGTAIAWLPPSCLRRIT